MLQNEQATHLIFPYSTLSSFGSNIPPPPPAKALNKDLQTLKLCSCISTGIVTIWFINSQHIDSSAKLQLYKYTCTVHAAN